MMNFLFGMVAGAVIACIVTIAAARNPDVQSRLGLIPSVQAAIAPSPPKPVLERCPVPSTSTADAKAASADKLFERRRFWFVAP